MHAVDDDRGQAAHQRLTGHEIADAPLVEPAVVVDDQDVASGRDGNRFQEYVRAARMDGRCHAPRDTDLRDERYQARWALPHRKSQSQTGVCDERRGPVEGLERGEEGHEDSVQPSPGAGQWLEKDSFGNGMLVPMRAQPAPLPCSRMPAAMTPNTASPSVARVIGFTARSR